MLASGSKDSAGHDSVVLWDATLTRQVAQLQHDGPVNSVAFSPDGRQLASFASDGAIRIWDVETTQLITNRVISAWPWGGVVAYSPDGLTLAVGDADGWIWLLDSAGADRKIIPAHRERAGTVRDGVKALAFSLDGKLLASASADIGLWDPFTGQEVSRFSGQGEFVTSLAFAPPDGNFLATGGSDQTIRFWDLKTKQELARLRGHLDEIQSLAFAPSGEWLASGSKDGIVCLWDPHRRPNPDGFASLPVSVWWNLAFSADGKRLVSVAGSHHFYDPGPLLSWDLATLQPTAPPIDAGTNNSSVAISPDGRLLVAGSGDGSIHVWDLARQHEVTNFPAHSSKVILLKFAAQGRFLLSRPYGEPKLWEADSWREVTPWKGKTNVCLAECSLDGQTTITAQEDGKVSFWNTLTGREVKTLAGHKSLQSLFDKAIAVSPDGKTLVTASTQSPALKLWDIAGRREVGSLRTDASAVLSVAFSPDGHRIATGLHEDSAVTLWDTATRRQLVILSGRGAFPTLGFSRDGNTVIGINAEGRVHLWRAPSWEEIAAAEAKEKTQ